MHSTNRPIAIPAALLAAFLLLAPAVPARAAAPLPAALTVDVNESYRLLAKTFYHPVEEQTLVDAARAAISTEAKRHGVSITVTPIRAGTDSDATLDALDSAIAETADVAHVAPSVIAYAAIDAMAHAVDDRWTTFLTPDEFKRFNDALDPEKVSGIGVLLGSDAKTGFASILYVMPQTPAERAGLRAGDTIVAVDGTQTKGLKGEAVSKLLRGKPGTSVRMTVRATDTAPTSDVTIVRAEISPPTVIYKMLPNGIGYIYVIAFGRETPAQFNVALDRLHQQGAKALVMDLRDDGGGYVESALDIVSRFVSQQPVVTVEERGQPASTFDAPSDDTISLPMTVLVNANTASASEITAGALQDDGIASLVGTRTFGKGVMQTLTPLPDGAAIKITTAHYLTPRRRDINLKGIDPDVRVDENRDARYGDVSKDAQLRAAIAFLQKKLAVTKP
ncbi:MAG: S41 family peptidase [bacterium]|nr:S41 family peptidase [bacterium]